MKKACQAIRTFTGISTFLSLGASAGTLHTYKVDVHFLNDNGDLTPLVGKPIRITVNFGGRRISYEKVLAAVTDANGEAEFTYDQNMMDSSYARYDGVGQFCGKMAKATQCGDLSNELSVQENGEKVALIPDNVKHASFDCEATHAPGFMTTTSTISVVCKNFVN